MEKYRSNSALTGKFVKLLAIISISGLTGMLYPIGEKFPALTEYSQNLVHRTDVGTTDERLEAIYECGYGHYKVCYYNLVKHLSDKNPKIRKASAQSLSLLQIDESITHLQKALETENEELVITSIIQAFGMIGLEEGGGIIEKYLTDPSDKIRLATAISFTRLSFDKFQQSISNAIAQEKSSTIKVVLIHASLNISSKNNDLIKELIKHLYSTDRLTRIRAAKAAADLKIKELLEPLAKAILFETDPMVREELETAYRETLWN